MFDARNSHVDAVSALIKSQHAACNKLKSNLIIPGFMESKHVSNQLQMTNEPKKEPLELLYCTFHKKKNKLYCILNSQKEGFKVLSET